MGGEVGLRGALWPKSFRAPGLAFFFYEQSLHWPAEVAEVGLGGASFIELLTLFELWTGEGLNLEKVVSQYRWNVRRISASAVPLCRFLGSVVRSLLESLGELVDSCRA